MRNDEKKQKVERILELILTKEGMIILMFTTKVQKGHMMNLFI